MPRLRQCHWRSRSRAPVGLSDAQTHRGEPCTPVVPCSCCALYVVLSPFHPVHASPHPSVFALPVLHFGRPDAQPRSRPAVYTVLSTPLGRLAHPHGAQPSHAHRHQPLTGSAFTYAGALAHALALALSRNTDTSTSTNTGTSTLPTHSHSPSQALKRAMRIGTNHGSLSSRILSFYGDTPRGCARPHTPNPSATQTTLPLPTPHTTRTPINTREQAKQHATQNPPCRMLDRPTQA